MGTHIISLFLYNFWIFIYLLHLHVKSRFHQEWYILVINNILLCDRQLHDRYKDTIFIVAINLPVPRTTWNRQCANFGKWGSMTFVTGRARIHNIWASASPASSEIGDTARNVKFTSVTFIVTQHSHVVASCRSLASATHRSVWALFYDGKPSNADRFTRKRLFVAFWRACGRPIRRCNNELEMGRRGLSGFNVRKLRQRGLWLRVYCITGCVGNTF